MHQVGDLFELNVKFRCQNVKVYKLCISWKSKEVITNLNSSQISEEAISVTNPEPDEPTLPTTDLIYLTHCGRVTQICVFTLQLCRTGEADLRF